MSKLTLLILDANGGILIIKLTLKRSYMIKLLIFDANVVISLHEYGLWAQITERCDVHLSRTVAESEADFYEDKSGNQIPIDLSPDEQAARITVFDLDITAIRAFERMFDCNYAAELDPGEKESLAHLVRSKEDYRICSGDHIVYKVLGNLNRGDQGISLEEVLAAIGLTRGNLPRQDKKSFRQEYTSMGQVDAIRGRGQKSK
jgi:hypothetical protein